MDFLPGLVAPRVGVSVTEVISLVPFTFLSFTLCIFCLLLLAQCSKHYIQHLYFVSGV